MKKSIFVFAIILNLSFQNGHYTKTQIIFNGNIERLNGHVKQIIEINHDHTTESESPLIVTTIANFDSNGNTFSERTKNFWEKKWRENKYFNEHDAKGRKTKTIIKSIENGIKVYTYGQDGNIRESALYWYKHRLIEKIIYKYDNKGNIIELISNGPDEHYKIEYKYDNQQNLIDEEEFYQSDPRGIKTIVEYKAFDKKENWLKKIRTEQVNRSSFKSSAYPADTITRKITYY